MMSEPMTFQAKCHACGFEAEASADDWETVDDPTLGQLTRCPGCGSTDVHSRG